MTEAHNARRIVRLAIGGLVALLLLASCTQAPGQQQVSTPVPGTEPPQQQPGAPESPGITVNLGTVGIATIAPMAANISTGAFTKHGIDLELVEHRSAAEGTQALTRGAIQIFLGDISQAASLRQQGQSIKVFGSAVEAHPFTLVGPSDAGTDVKLLKGKKIGISNRGSLGDYSLRWLLRTNGLDPDKDAVVTALGSDDAAVSALENKQAYAVVTAEPQTSQLLAQGFVAIYDFATQVKPYSAGVFMAKQSWLKDNADLARSFLKAQLAATKQLNSDEKTRDGFYQQVLDGVEPQAAKLAGRRMHGAWSTTGKVTEAAVGAPFEIEKLATGQDKPAPKIAELVDDSYLP